MRFCSPSPRARAALGALWLLATAIGPARADVLLQGFYWDVPSPAADAPTAPWWYDRLAARAKDIAAAGFTSVWLPPVLKGASGGYSVGYDPFDDYDLGSKPQMGTIPTRYGTRTQLQRAAATLRSNGLGLMADLVLNHRNGDDGSGFFRPMDAYGVPGLGRYGKSPWDFAPAVANDPDVYDNPEIGFGRNVAVYNGGGTANLSAWNYNQLIAAGDWLTKALDLSAYRIDYAKGVSTSFIQRYLESGSMAGKYAVAEFWDSNRDTVRWWKGNTGHRVAAFDFPLRDLLKEMCDANGGFDMRRLHGAGLVGIDPFGSMTFVENHDTDKDPGLRIVSGKMLAYALILMAEGYPSVFYRDWADEAGCYGLRNRLAPLIRVHEKIAAGTTRERWMDSDVYVFERLGGQRLLAGLNDHPSASRTVTVQTGFGPNTALVDYSGHQPGVTTDSVGRATITIPANIDGAGYVCYSRPGAPATVAPRPRSTTQEFAGAPDLDIAPAESGRWIEACRLDIAKATPMTTRVSFDTTQWTDQTRLEVRIVAGTDTVVRSISLSRKSAQGSGLLVRLPVDSTVRLQVRSKSTPAGNLAPRYWLRVTYTAPLTPLP